MSQVKDLIAYLKRSHKPTDTIAYDLWTVEDVKQVYEESGHKGKLTDEQAKDVLNKVEHYFDANIGINWENLRFHLDDVLENK